MGNGTNTSKGGPPHVRGSFGIWLSKRAVEVMEFPFRHTLTYQTGGWRLDVIEPGKLVARIGDRRDAFDLEEGDFILSSGDDLYLALNREGRDASGRQLPPADAKREERPRPKARKKAAKKSAPARSTKGA